MDKRYRSHAKWSTGKITEDDHEKEIQAEKICNYLLKTYRISFCPTRGKCLEVWISKDNKIIKIKAGNKWKSEV